MVTITVCCGLWHSLKSLLFAAFSFFFYMFVTKTCGQRDELTRLCIILQRLFAPRPCTQLSSMAASLW